MTVQLRATVNGVIRDLPRDGRRLVHWLREDLGLTGTKHPCGSGHCGGCSVLVDGRVTLSCMTLATVLDGARITTVEGLAEMEDVLHRCFVEQGAVQCGFCTPGMVMAARAYLDSLGDRPASERGIREALAGNICRCTGYAQIVRAVATASEISQANHAYKEVSGCVT
jgi:aerobic-type carbon monoxide dehydrogenase small subunit (CoxS/CutS family)